ncbi:glycosyltransferase [Jatrophihabitans sp.]|uniref:glycosyltransferase n=1 Tax=Jatrophihabitans sp. TaxID=1932789 RepID=UPI0030C76753|nr:hypothetical protein [Jatrophihabitans sp.]
MTRLTTLGSALAVLGTAHAALNARLVRRPLPGTTTSARISVLIPARDEAATIAACLGSLRAQDVQEILVLDDGSSDGTSTVAAAVGDPRVRVLTGTPPPPGWLGKPHACIQLAAAADPSSDVLVFLDADVRLCPGGIAAAVALLDEHQLDLVSPQPRELAETAGERLVQPLLQWSIRTLLPLRIAERSSHASLAAANGQFIAVRREVYERAGGHRPDAVLDDVALARAVRAAGGRGAVVDGSAVATCRMYDGWAELRDGHGKSLWSAFGSEPGSAAVFALLGLAYVLPPVAAVRGSRVGLLGYAAAVAGRALVARDTGERVWPDSLAHPLSVTLLGWLTLRSHRLHRRGSLRWRGRAV